ncbi:hypothetical protein SMC5_06820 [Candidatus Cryosericum odellii]|jgi:hypothetical protein|uniref:Uncharacterized protein n=1 Tax=Candidatus Cryosericum odellii TaxID=2290917 RepID=A0A398D4E5_9BACT|nr:hypothetical protein SMC5_06820 [Candidatus Cryosericum odellii]
MVKSPLLRYCYGELMSDEKKFPHTSDQGEPRVLVFVGQEVFVKRSSALIVLDTAHAGWGENLLRRGFPALESSK